MWDEKDTSHMRNRLRHHRPEWWPVGESWPPATPNWRNNRGRFMRRFGCLVFLVNLLALLILVVVIGLIANSLGFIHFSNSFWWIIPASIFLFFCGLAFLILIGRNLQRFSAPLGDLVEAAGRITQGDFSTPVRERGSPEIRSLVRAFNSMAARLKVTEEQRRDLMADISHELRTPITVIQGNLEGIIDGVYAPEEGRLRSVLEETQVLSRLVDDLRTLALAESGALQLKKEPTDLEVLIGETVSAFRAQADAGGVGIDLQMAANAPLLKVDPERIRQVLSNLIANSLRYTQRGGCIRVSLATRGDIEKTAIVTVEDNGVGIDPDVLPNVFQRFIKSRDSSGTGLGLPIARHLVEAHGGTITAESQVGKGTTIRFTLPIEDEG